MTNHGLMITCEAYGCIPSCAHENSDSWDVRFLIVHELFVFIHEHSVSPTHEITCNKASPPSNVACEVSAIAFMSELSFFSTSWMSCVIGVDAATAGSDSVMSCGLGVATTGFLADMCFPGNCVHNITKLMRDPPMRNVVRSSYEP